MRERPTMASHRLDLPSICDICGKARSTRKHAACSRTRQQLKREEWASYMDNIVAKKAQGGSRTETCTEVRKRVGASA